MRNTDEKTLKLDKTSTALVVIDLQKGIVSRPAEPYSPSVVVENAARLAGAFRRNNMPVFLVHVASSEADRLRPIADKPTAVQRLPAEWSDFVPEIGPEESDIVVTKRQWGAFYGTGLDLQLRRRRMDTIVLCGISTNVGVESTARFAYEYGYQQVFAEDAMSARSKEAHDASILIFKRIGRVRKTQEILQALG
jgi:nicotinamidase-related amidase